MKEVNKLFKQSLAYAGFVGKVQGLFHFVNENPTFYSTQELADRVAEYEAEMNAEIEDVVEQD